MRPSPSSLMLSNPADHLCFYLSAFWMEHSAMPFLNTGSFHMPILPDRSLLPHKGRPCDGTAVGIIENFKNQPIISFGHNSSVEFFKRLLILQSLPCPFSRKYISTVFSLSCKTSSVAQKGTCNGAGCCRVLNYSENLLFINIRFPLLCQEPLRIGSLDVGSDSDFLPAHFSAALSGTTFFLPPPRAL